MIEPRATESINMFVAYGKLILQVAIFVVVISGLISRINSSDDEPSFKVPVQIPADQ